MKPADTMKSLAICFKAGQRPLLHGVPGIGKSELVLQAADLAYASAYGMTVETPGMVSDKSGQVYDGRWPRPWYREFRTSQRDAVDLTGLPAANDGKTVWLTPEFMPTDPRGGVFFLDEINRGTEMVCNAAFSLLDRGEVGNYQMPKSWICCAAQNDLDIGARKLSSALSRRFIHIDCETDLEDVCKFAVARDWAPETIAFLRFRPDLLNQYDAKARVSPNPRAWSFISELTKQAPPKSIEHALFTGTIGEAASIEYSGFLRLYRELPNVDQIFLDPRKAPIPTAPASLYAVSAALARRVTDRTFGRMLQYLDRLSVEYNVMAVKDACRRLPALASTPDFTKWSVAHSDVTF